MTRWTPAVALYLTRRAALRMPVDREPIYVWIVWMGERPDLLLPMAFLVHPDEIAGVVDDQTDGLVQLDVAALGGGAR